MTRKIGNIPFLGMDLRPLDRQSPDGLCEMVKNLRPKGLQERPYWERIREPLAQNWRIGSNLDYEWYFDSRGRALLVVLTQSEVKLLDPDNDYAELNAYQLSGKSDDRRLHVAQVSELLVVAITEHGVSDTLLLLVDDNFVEFEYPRELTHGDHSNQSTKDVRFVSKRESPMEGEDPEDFPYRDQENLPSGFYSFRLAYRLRSGDYLPAGMPGTLGLVKRIGTTQPPEYANVSFSLKVVLKKPELPKPWDELIDGVGVFIAVNSEDPLHIDGLFHDAVYYRVFDLDLSDVDVGEQVSAKVGGQEDKEYGLDDIFAMPHYQDNNALSFHRLAGSVCQSYNNRILIGDTSLDFGAPVLHGEDLSTSQELTWEDYRPISYVGEPWPGPVVPRFVLKMAVRIVANNKAYWRESDPIAVYRQWFEVGIPRHRHDEDGPTPDQTGLPMRAVHYFDRRATHVRFFAKEDNAPDDMWTEVEASNGSLEPPLARDQYGYVMQRSRFGNYAWLECTVVKVLEFIGEMGDFADASELQNEPNRIVVSDADNPLLFRTSAVHYVGTSHDRITGFGVNTLPISQGQFGQYPLYVFASQSIYALEQVQDARIAFGRLSPVSIREGLVDSRAVTNAGRQIIFVSHKGVAIIGARGISYVSAPIDKLLLPRIDDGICLGYHRQPELEEIWVGTTDKTFVYSIAHNRWSVLDRGSKKYLSRADEGALYSMVGQKLYQEDASPSPVMGRIRSRPIHLGAVDFPKKLYELIFRLVASEWNVKLEADGQQVNSMGNDVVSLRNRYGAAYSFVAEVEAEMLDGDWIESMDVDYEVRRPHRRKRTLQAQV